MKTPTPILRALGASLFAFTLFAVTPTPSAEAAMKTFAIRLKPGQDLVGELKKFAEKEKIRAGFIITAVGSLKKAKIRFANQPEMTEVPGFLEIVSLTGTLSINGSHLHGSFSDKEGKTFGGHLAEGSPIYTTAEIVIGEIEELDFVREKDPETTWNELKIIPRKK